MQGSSSPRSTKELNITWFKLHQKLTLLPMQKRPVKRGRPVGATSFDADIARAFGAAVRSLRNERGISQESLADRKSTRLNSSHVRISYAVFCLKKKKRAPKNRRTLQERRAARQS